MKCPNCEVEPQMAEQQKVEIDYCPRCRGVWLDRGELERIIERACDEQTIPALPLWRAEECEERRRQREREEREERFTRPRGRSFLSELFVNRLDAARDSEVAPKLLQVRSLDDLKHRVAGLLLLVLVIEFFQRALRLSYDTPLDLLLLALGVLLIAGSFYLSNLRQGKDVPAGGEAKAGGVQTCR